MFDDPAAESAAPVWDEAERAALVALLRERPDGLSWPELTAEVSGEGSARAVWERLVPGDLFGAESATLTQAASDVAAWRGADFEFLTFLDEAYPVQLREVHEMPPVLFARGTLRPADPGICVVGSRSASEHGRRVAGVIARNLAQRDITVVSGLAKGIDTAAHTAALEAGGRTVACIGTGITGHYPAENRELQERIAQDGLVLSQFWPDAPPRPQNFPMRNAIMSGYGRATVIVEAGEKSGARIQARRAVEHGRSVILIDKVVETNTWAKALVDRPGVHVATSTREVMDLAENLLHPKIPTDDLLSRFMAMRGEQDHRH
ncbi:DNA-processing protein DprA [Saccharopolyspora gloriosae]|uniref:DNA-processing protein DprA n=1 Tax=Saccharopolyspora gloriosae TaxID=455344 RepID=UPI001FB7983A|nr:DNA-processing protein DprA [Saccharopolyspora gloriosae]